ncbi:uncharacterized protein E0L32_009713 [Thyridium curvatum]|uniref:RRM domain-containing protein n=1 Tax=Thyridium curvatum TaxID=1093900 RepID=A0A507AMA2_9PEZI|nr:uncharacterized protein E0L32_009713 [Thyridium curvatum]TPX08773.1 hypothetical protein E0L32_009713 [Thyridium curvatum]
MDCFAFDASNDFESQPVHSNSTPFITSIPCVFLFLPLNSTSPVAMQLTIPFSLFRHCVRRAGLRSAFLASRAIATKPQSTSFAAEIARSTSVVRACVIPAARSFSQSSPFLNTPAEDTADSKAVEDALKSAEELGSTTAEGESLAESAASGEAAAPSEPAAHDVSNPVLTATGPGDAPETVKYDEAAGETPHAIFIRNIIFNATEDLLQEAFSSYGEVAKAAIARDARGISKGFGFVWFKDADSVEKALEEANGSFWHGRRLIVLPRTTRQRGTNSRTGGEPSRSLYIGNIPYETTDAELNRLFRGLENVTAIRVAVDRTTGWPRGFAHADFVDSESATKALEKLQGFELNGRQLRFDYASSSPKATRAPRASDDA